MNKYFILSVALFAMVMGAPANAATGLKIQPLEYDARLASGQKQRGVVDISNPSDERIRVELKVQAVRQMNSDGELEFYDDQQMSKGIVLDQTEVDLPPKALYRLVFELDSTKLPAGDSVAVIFARTTAKSNVIGGSARVGTLIHISNGTPSGRDVSVGSIDIAWLHTDNQVRGTYSILNKSDAASTTGFKPDVTVTLAPLHQPHVISGPLVFAGNERQGGFSIPTNALGIYRLIVSSGDSRQSRLVVLLPAWSLLVFIGGILLAMAWLSISKRKRIKFTKAP